MAWHIATRPSGLLPLIERLDKRIGLRNGGFHGANQGRNPIDHQTGAVLAYVFGRCKDAVFLQLKALLEPFGLTRFYTDHWRKPAMTSVTPVL